MKYLDGIKPAPTNRLQAWEYWVNHLQSKFLTLPMRSGRRIKVQEPYEC